MAAQGKGALRATGRSILAADAKRRTPPPVPNLDGRHLDSADVASCPRLPLTAPLTLVRKSCRRLLLASVSERSSRAGRSSRVRRAHRPCRLATLFSFARPSATKTPTPSREVRSALLQSAAARLLARPGGRNLISCSPFMRFQLLSLSGVKSPSSSTIIRYRQPTQRSSSLQTSSSAHLAPTTSLMPGTLPLA